MKKDYYSNSKDYINRWVVSYADFVTMLLALFMVLFAISRIDNNKMSDVQMRMKQTFSAKLQNAESEIVSKEQEIAKVKEEVRIIKEKNQKAEYNINENLITLESMFKENLSGTNSINIVKQNRGLVIRVDSALLFDNGSADIKRSAVNSLSKIVKTLTKIDNPVIIEGHTDSIPIKTTKFPSNWELSTARATNIIKYIVKNSDINPKRLCAVGYGEYMPVGDNTTNKGRILNRRVDIIVLANNKEVGENQNGETE